VRPTVLVVGAGMAGLAAAGRLAGAGVGVSVLDKGRGVGGRVATRRVDGARFDHGAQFFTARSPTMEALSADWLARDVAQVWCRGFLRDDGHPRYVGTGGMTALAKDLARDLDVQVGVRVSAVGFGADRRWHAALAPPAGVPSGAGRSGRDGSDPGAGAWSAMSARGADAVVLTAPVPQTLALLDAGRARLPEAIGERLRSLTYHPTLAALVVLDGPSSVPAPGGVQLDDGFVSWVGDNQAKGVSARPALTLHASSAWSTAHLDDPLPATLGALLHAGRRWWSGAEVRHAEAVRWRFATPTCEHDQRCVATSVPGTAGAGLVVLAGDAFGEARVEGAVLSGLAAADAVLERIAPA